MRAPNVLTISPALPFIDTFVAALLRGEVIGTLADDPLVLADTTIYVPTQRAARGLADALLKQAGRTSVALPRILPLGSLEATETAMIFAEPDLATSGLPLPPAASPIWRRLRLATLIQQWATSLRGALCSVDASGMRIVDPTEAFRVATSSVDAFALAGDLAGLIDELLIEDVAWHALGDLKMAEFDDYWRITTDFLAIAIDVWPEILAESGLVDPASRQIALVEAQTKALGEGASGPVIAIGSTGTNKATARLLAAIARAPRGAVVLPGLDIELDDASWSLIAGRIGEGQEPSFGHPQAAMARLLPILDIGRADVRTLGVAGPEAAARARFVAEAMRPADTTDLWRDYRRAVPRKAIVAALSDVTLIEAADEREEALCLAIALREILETPGRTGALVTPDRELARRVRGELLRWSIEVSDTGGEPLASRPLGILARLVAAAAATLSARDLGALLAHPLAVFGRDRGLVARLAALIEIGLLRCVPLDGTDQETLFAAARAAAADRHAHPAQREIEAGDWQLMEALWHDVLAALAPLQAIEGRQSIDVWAEAHVATLASVAGAGVTDEVEALESLFEELASPAASLRVDAGEYGIFFGRLAGEANLRNTERPHPRLRIYGLLEARLVQADVMLLAGLDETIWPPQATSDPFLNRPMRRDLGLSPPERRIGQTAHDFTMATGHGTIIMSRARKRGGSPCVPSRFLLRLEALAGKAWDPCRDRGRRFVKLAQLLDDPGKAPVAIGRPRPMPPVDLRPVRLSVTQIETLRRDPYSIYAALILNLAPLPQLGTELDAGTFGDMMHAILHRFSESEAARGSYAVRLSTLRGLAREAFGKALADPVFDAFRWPVILKTIDTFLSFDAAQRETTATIDVETTGRLPMVLADQSSFLLTARADRIDRHRDGSATLIDYKTGQPPGRTEVQVGFAPQLTLEAAILRGGGFGTAHAGDIAATYLKLGGRDGGFIRDLVFDDEQFSEVVTRHFEGLHRLLSSFRNLETAYPSRPFPKYAKAYGDFDHLARVREWSLSGDDEATP
jgi:ATP-dependent helicase/nuclease subunit B